MEPLTVVLIGLALIVCAYMAWNIGANDVANAMGTSVGSRALTLKQAVIIAAVFEFAGAFFAGDAVTDTVRKGILSVDFTDPMVDDVFSTDIALGFIAAMMAAATWLTIATRYGLPVSTTHSIIGGILGVGLILEVKYSTDLIDWEVVRKVVLSWVASPLMGGLIGFFSFIIIKKRILDNDNPVERGGDMDAVGEFNQLKWGIVEFFVKCGGDGQFVDVFIERHGSCQQNDGIGSIDHGHVHLSLL